MRVVELTAFGGAEHFHDATRKPLPLGRDDLRIAVKAVSFNPIDYQLRSAAFPGITLPWVLGFDVAGIVTEAGVTGNIQAGDEVIAYLGGPHMAGGYASEIVVPRSFVALKPKIISFAEAAAIPLAGLTALQSLRRTGIRPDQSLLIAGGGGGAGSWVARIAQALGVTRISATAGRAESRAYLTGELGLDPARLVDYLGASFEELAARAIAGNDGRPFDVAIDCAGKVMTQFCCAAIGFQGHVVSIVNGPDAAMEEKLFDRSASFHSELVYAAAEFGNGAHREIYARQLADLTALIEDGKLKLPRITALGPLSAAIVAEAHRRLESGTTLGKLVATVA